METNPPPAWHLNHADMDATHQEFLGLLQAASTCPVKQLTTAFEKLVSHTELHFVQELQWMQNSKFPALGEHRDEHQRILGELNFHLKRLNQGKTTMALAYLKEYLPEWFNLHVSSMDSALAQHLHKTAVEMI